MAHLLGYLLLAFHLGPKILNFHTRQEDSQTGNAAKSTFARLASSMGLHLPAKASGKSKGAEGTSTTAQLSVLESLTKGFIDSSLSAVKAVQVKARHIVSQNKRRYQEGGFDLDMTYITENIIAMGFPAGDMSSGFFGFVEGKYKVYNLCSERLYDAPLFEGKVASFPFDDHNCPPIELITLFCQSAYTWLKEDILNVVVVHCKAGMARTGLMISNLLLFLKRYVKYFERLLTYFNGVNQPGRRCMLRGFWLVNCPYWIRPSITITGHNDPRFTDCVLQRKIPSLGFQLEIVMIDYDGSIPIKKKSMKARDLMEEWKFSLSSDGVATTPDQTSFLSPHIDYTSSLSLQSRLSHPSVEAVQRTTEVLAMLVKAAQQQGMEGSEGDWEVFLSKHDKLFGSRIRDPRKKSAVTSARFLKTFSRVDDVKCVCEL
ncbi:Phosphatidylinositol 3,4,5-trisphosphate 3-phosphatase and protein-tyrosine-phosphatase PTEN2A [Camellia lanceoleosa]|uniref:Phosphatidylinositol 3,4,5-trisphosphate 3-phosphatase and protein-tyrosine-phosphatase PTEN2A n=1 Tax=Camellia lanceoleosa TaxID=1840588 RepID=A0ACC0FPK8_9ERIC|nr:Phosphatidylinositol 3,4,5-trisphosphate 3-phosphatase and protein-tyrosine-phosphatase PTEN2A [Camellia lanceoleosa]